MSALDMASDPNGWKISGCHVYLEYSQSDYYSDEYISITYCPEFNYTDTGDRMELPATFTPRATTKPTAKPTAKPTPKPTIKTTAKPTAKPTAKSAGKECPECKGTGKCQKCGGDMWYWGWKWKYVNGSPELVNVNELCDEVYCNGGTCDKCDGDGVL